jgi:hypothetical protein
MTGRRTAPPAHASLEERRRATLSELESLHGTRAIGAEEYRRRAEVARRAVDETELEAVRPSRDERSAKETARAPAPRPAPPAHRVPLPSPRVPAGEETGFVFACMGSSLRRGLWEPPEVLYALSLMGGVELDFREASLLEGTTEVVAIAVMGGVKITVPDDVDVEVNGIGLMGGFDHVSHHQPGPDRPLIRVKGLALMGGVSVKVKPAPGSSAVKRLAKRVRGLV